MFYFHTLAPRRMVFRAGVFVVAPQRMPTISPIGICPNLLNRRAMSVPTTITPKPSPTAMMMAMTTTACNALCSKNRLFNHSLLLRNLDKCSYILSITKHFPHNYEGRFIPCQTHRKCPCRGSARVFPAPVSGVPMPVPIFRWFP